MTCQNEHVQERPHQSRVSCVVCLGRITGVLGRSDSVRITTAVSSMGALFVHRCSALHNCKGEFRVKVYYSTDDHQIFEHEVSEGTCIHRPLEQRQVIEECAEQYFNEHDGWEAGWPLEFRLHNWKTNEVIARLKVELEFEPAFTANIVNETSGND